MSQLDRLVLVPVRQYLQFSFEEHGSVYPQGHRFVFGADG
jgi:hypothetical protein